MKSKCIAVTNKAVARKGKPSLEFHHRDGRPAYYCQGYVDSMTDELIRECAICENHVTNAQNDFEKESGDAEMKGTE